MSSQSSVSPKSSGSLALRYGTIFGLGWGVLLIVHGLVSAALGISWTRLLVIPLSLVVYLVAGMLAAQETGKVPTGLVAGLFTGLFSSIIDAIVSVLVLARDHARLERMRAQAQQIADQSGAHFHYTVGIILIGTAVGLLLEAAVATAVGLGMGALGGVIGKSRAPAPQMSYQEAMYQGMSANPYGAPGYPQYPQGQMPGAYPPPPGAYPPPSAYPPPPAQPGPEGWPQQPPQQPPQGQ